ncbi:Tubulin polyglutamylase complex subunit 2 [Thoreauomyces humboldtii]|nr:Tubulin polyglutamylase complex subunit 2 [Thoreauomyces humboldtii]
MSPAKRSAAAVSAVTSNLITYLETCPSVTGIKTSSNPPLTPSELKMWTRLHSPHRLPSDVIALLHMTDGLKVQWSVQNPCLKSLANTASNQTPRPAIDVGCVEINSLKAWRRFEEGRPPGIAFVIHSAAPYGQVCMVFVPTCPAPASADASTGTSAAVAPAPSVFPATKPAIYMYAQGTGTWHFLASSFSAYFRMLVVHLGIKGWQMGWTDVGMSQATMDWLGMYATARVEMYRRERAKRLWGSKRGRESLASHDGANARPSTPVGAPGGGKETGPACAAEGEIPFNAARVKQLVAAAKAALNPTPPVKAERVPSNMRPVTR